MPPSEPRRRRPTKSQTLATMQEDIRLGIEYRRKYGRADRWADYKRWYRGEFSGRGVLPVNIMYAMARATIARARLANPRVRVTAPMRPELFFHAKLVEALDNWLIRELALKETLKRMILNAYLMGVAPWVAGYDSQYGLSPEDLMGGETFTSFSRTGTDRIEYNAAISPGMPWVRAANPEDFVVPWGSTSFQEVPWYAIRFIRPTDEMKSDSKYQNRDAILPNLAADTTGLTKAGDSRRAIYAKMAETGQFTEAWELHDARTGKVYVFTLDGDKFLREEDDVLQLDGFSAGAMNFNDDVDNFWVVPDAAIIEPQQLEINDITTQWAKHRRTAVSKIFARQKAISPSAIEKITSEDVRAVVEVASSDLSKDLKFADGNIPDDFRIAREMVRQDVREAVGFSRNQLGEFQGKTHISASEQAAVAQGSEVRIDERRDAVADTLVTMLRRVNQMIFTFWDQPRVLQVVGQSGAASWVRYKGTDLRGEYLIQMDPDSSPEMNGPARQANLLQLAQLVAQAGGNVIPLLQQALGEMPGINVSEVLPGAAGPQQQGGRPPAIESFDQFRGAV